MQALIYLVDSLFSIYTFLLFAWVILSWLVAFNVVNTNNRIVYLIGDFLNRITEPALRPIRRFIPDLGGIDISPVILILVMHFLRILVIEDILLPLAQ